MKCLLLTGAVTRCLAYDQLQLPSVEARVFTLDEINKAQTLIRLIASSKGRLQNPEMLLNPLNICTEYI